MSILCSAITHLRPQDYSVGIKRSSCCLTATNRGFDIKYEKRIPSSEKKNWKCCTSKGMKWKVYSSWPIIWCFVIMISIYSSWCIYYKQMAPLCHFIPLFMTVYCFTFLITFFFDVNNFSPTTYGLQRKKTLRMETQMWNTWLLKLYIIYMKKKCLWGINKLTKKRLSWFNSSLPTILLTYMVSHCLCTKWYIKH